ncbi:hypothetical protein L1987_76378 [Smallanthus sonchifolius]|uniref:Uncharacterized protein n=1 Tax=Smallanthus sonchifolius TaxID=185202 RepID=A0ACB9ACE5_9ASTR|nr:hypothetical protein L1987_76378 [Smallanthus sonchifolius]
MDEYLFSPKMSILPNTHTSITINLQTPPPFNREEEYKRRKTRSDQRGACSKVHPSDSCSRYSFFFLFIQSGTPNFIYSYPFSSN